MGNLIFIYGDMAPISHLVIWVSHSEIGLAVMILKDVWL